MRSRVIPAALCAIVLACSSSLCAASDPYANTAAVARKAAAAALKDAGVFSGTTAVIVDGTIVYAEAFGMIGADRATPPDTTTQFNAGSISKVFTAVAMLRLRDLGRVDLDRPVVDYLPQFRMNDARYSQITIRTLLDHTSGIPGTNYYRLFSSKQNPAYVTETLALLQDSAMKSNPGDINVYCNDCFTVAQAVIEQVSGMSFADFVQREIFMKAGMHNSSYAFMEGNRNIAAAYAPHPPYAMLPSEIANARGTGGLTTTAVDLSLFARALMEGRLLKPGSMRQLQKKHDGRLGSGYSLTEAGLGWDSVAEPDFAARGLTVLGKDGITTVFRSQMYVAPRQNIAVSTILVGPVALPIGVVTDMSKSIMWAALQDKGFLAASASVPTQLPPLATIPAYLLQFAGIYGGLGHSIVKLTFDPAANVLVAAKLNDGAFEPGAPFVYRSDGRFYAGNQSYSFKRRRDGRNVLLLHADGEHGVATILEGVSPDDGADTSAFDRTTWVPRNLRAFDFFTLFYDGLFKTGSVPGLPGIIYLQAGTPRGAVPDAVPYGLANRYQARMILQAEVDLVDLEIVDKAGSRVLRVDAFEFTDASAVPPMAQLEQVVIGPDGGNVVRKVVAGTSFNSSIPPNGRILIYQQDGMTAFDSLIDGNKFPAIAPGWHVVFVGDPDAIFMAQTL